MADPILHGIPNCDTVKRALAWLAGQGVAAQFHDFRKAGVPEPALQRWVDVLGWELLLNRRGTTWRQLPESVRASVQDAASAMALMRTQPSLIKRPVVDWPDGSTTVGFDAERFGARIAG